MLTQNIAEKINCLTDAIRNRIPGEMLLRQVNLEFCFEMGGAWAYEGIRLDVAAILDRFDGVAESIVEKARNDLYSRVGHDGAVLRGGGRGQLDPTQVAAIYEVVSDTLEWLNCRDPERVEILHYHRSGKTYAIDTETGDRISLPWSPVQAKSEVVNLSVGDVGHALGRFSDGLHAALKAIDERGEDSGAWAIELTLGNALLVNNSSSQEIEIPRFGE